MLSQIGLREVTEALGKRFPGVKRSGVSIAFEAVSGLLLGRLSLLASATKEIAEARKAHSEWTAVYLALAEKTRE
jgi:hypothetical protein